MKPDILISHPFGNANVRHAALAFAEADLLFGFRTCIDWPGASGFDRFLPESILEQLQRRSFPAAVSAKTSTQPLSEYIRLAAMRLGWSSWIKHEVGPFSVDAVTQRLDTKVADELLRSASPPNTIYAYEDGAAASFRAAKNRQIRCIYDLPIGYWKSARSIQMEEQLLQPEWANTITVMLESRGKLDRKDSELADSDAIVVASRFTAKTLTDHGFPTKKIHIIPYGCPPPISTIAAPCGGPLRILFAGSLGQRKGTSYLLSAVARLGKRVSLTLLGSRPQTPCAPLERALKLHRWLPSLPHAEVLKEMQRHDVLVFPSLFEGFGLVITEALSQGLPVITTPHTAGPDILTEGEDGYIVPIRNDLAIVEKLELLLTHPEHLRSMKAAAIEKAKMLTWEKYRSRLVATVSEIAP